MFQFSTWVLPTDKKRARNVWGRSQFPMRKSLIQKVSISKLIFILTKFYSFSVKKRSLPAQQQKGSKKLRQRLSTSSSSCTSTCTCRELAFGSVHKVLKRDRNTGNYMLIREDSEIQKINERFFYSYIFQTRRPENMMLEVYQAMREKIAALWDGYLYEGIVPWNIFKNFNVIFNIIFNLSL